jgi:hypothetical protein
MAEQEKAVPVPLPPSKSWKGWLWDSADVSKEERKFLLKVGYTVLSYTEGPGTNQTSLFSVGLLSFGIRYAWNVYQMGK